MTEKEKFCNDVCDRLERGEINETQAVILLIRNGADPDEAREIIFIAQGGSDVVGHPPEQPTPPNQTP